MLEPSALDSEMSRLRQRLLGTEDALRNALEHNQQVDQLVQAMRRHPEKSPVTLMDGWMDGRQKQLFRRDNLLTSLLCCCQS